MLQIDKIQSLTQKFNACAKFIPGILTGNEIAEKVIASAAKLEQEENKSMAAIPKDTQELLTLDMNQFI
jgi:prephenate dehydratase